MPFLIAYKKLQKRVKKCCYSDINTELFAEVFKGCDDFLASLDRVSLTSNVPGKQYFAFKRGSKLSRAINSNLFMPNTGLENQWCCLNKSMSDENLSDISPTELQSVSEALRLKQRNTYQD